MTTLYHTLFVDTMYSLEHNNMTAAPVIKGNTSGFLPTGASLSISKWRLREIGVLTEPRDCTAERISCYERRKLISQAWHWSVKKNLNVRTQIQLKR